ncbi:lamin tail domain-containing protein [Streptomyces sp. NPDC021356]|uniref:lamin tail domain-containing protein n=1 Tax=Streptomyces sp. NPDC021356 TaxID=3154900 RepID=UPI00340D413F
MAALPASADDPAGNPRPQSHQSHPSHKSNHSHHQSVVISGVHLDDRARAHHSDRALNTEWVEITNNSRRDVNLDGWTLADQHGHTYTFRHYRLDGRATVRVHTGYGHDTHRDLYQDRRTSVWDRHDTATLRNDHRRFVDSVSWGGDRHDDRR